MYKTTNTQKQNKCKTETRSLLFNHFSSVTFAESLLLSHFFCSVTVLRGCGVLCGGLCVLVCSLWWSLWFNVFVCELHQCLLPPPICASHHCSLPHLTPHLISLLRTTFFSNHLFFESPFSNHLFRITFFWITFFESPFSNHNFWINHVISITFFQSRVFNHSFLQSLFSSITLFFNHFSSITLFQSLFSNNFLRSLFSIVFQSFCLNLCKFILFLFVVFLCCV